MARIRILFFGTPEITLPTLRALREAPFVELIGVVTQPDKPKGRDLKLEPPAAKIFAIEHQIPYWQPIKARDAEFLEQVRLLSPDLIVVFAYGQILPQALLDLPRWHCLNLHTSLLPKYRGAAPIQWAILNGDGETGVTLMQMEAGLDTGPLITRVSTPILNNDNGQTVHDRLAQLGAELLLQSLPDWVQGKLVSYAQPEGSTYARKITKEDGALDWSFSAEQLCNRIKAMTPWPGTFTHWQGPKGQQLIKIWRGTVASGHGLPGTLLNSDRTGLVVACGEGALRLMEIQREGGRRLPVEQFLAGFPMALGSKFATVIPPL